MLALLPVLAALAARRARRSLRAHAARACLLLTKRCPPDRHHPSAVPVKWAMAKMGKSKAGIRSPLAPLGMDFHSRVEGALQQASAQI